MLYLLNGLWTLWCGVCAWVGLASLSTYALVLLLQALACRRPPNLRRQYDAEWALVTGASSGIGRALAEKLAGQGLHVVLVALDNELLSQTTEALRRAYPAVQFRPVGVDLGDPSGAYLTKIRAATEDLRIDLLFNNAGYICTGLFADTEEARWRANWECNAGSAVRLTHHFLRLMVARRRRGLITFTSSASSYLPGPTATLYSPSKAFLTNFATTLAAENRDVGIDVVVIHPSPVKTNFYKNEGPALDSLRAAQKAAASPMNIADQIVAAAGRLTVWDQGLTCAAFRLVNKVIDFQLLSELITRLAFLNGDHQRLARASTIRGGGKTS